MIAFALIWIVSSVLSYGLLYPFSRHVSNHSPDTERADHIGSIWVSVGGPFSLIVAIVLSDYAHYGLTWQRDIPSTMNASTPQSITPSRPLLKIVCEIALFILLCGSILSLLTWVGLQVPNAGDQSYHEQR